MPRRLTPDDFYAIRLADDPQISPDGAHIVFVRQEVDRELYEYRRTLWIVSTEGGEPRQFTQGPNDTSPRWSPDGRAIAFVRAPASGVKPSNEEERNAGKGRPQIWTIAADGGEARQLTHTRYGASTPVWSPDGATIAFVSRTGEPDDSESVDAELHGKHLPRVRTITQIWYRADGQGFFYDTRAHLFSIPAAGGEAQQLTDGDWNDAAPAWSPDGTHIAFLSDRSEHRWSTPASQVWVLDVASGEQMRICSEDLGAGAPAWSPDGQALAFQGSPRFGGSGHTDMYVAPANPEIGPERSLTQDFTPSCDDSCNSDQRAGHGGGHPRWSPDGQEIFFQGTLRGTVHVYAARPDGSAAPRQVTSGAVQLYAFSLDDACKTLALGLSSPTIPGDVYTQPVSAGEARRLTELNAELFSQIQLADAQEYTYRGQDDWELQGWVMRPADAAPDAKLPAVLEIHGGPATTYGYGFFLEFQLLAARGYAVIYTNPRGSTGYGREFTDAVIHDWGNKDFSDVMDGLDAAIARGGIDPDRLGVAGGSYGGFMTTWVVGHTDRFKAAVTMRQLANWASFFGTSDIGTFFTRDHIGATPWENLEEVMRHSPITYVANIHTPLLIIHSDNDLRCPISESEQVFAALKYLGRETKFIRFEEQTHDLSRGGHPRSRVIRLNEVLGWFDTYMKAE